MVTSEQAVLWICLFRVCLRSVLMGVGGGFSLRWRLHGISLEEEREDLVGRARCQGTELERNWQDTGTMSHHLPDPGFQACSAVIRR